MIPYDPESSAEILRATHILLVTVLESAPHAWTPVSERLQRRDVDVVFSISRVLKGVTAESPGVPVRATVQQFEVIGDRYFRVPGVWSEKELVREARFVTFSSSAFGTEFSAAGSLLTEPECFVVDRGNSAVFDVALADWAGTPPEPLGSLMRATAPQRPDYGKFFARYVEARLPEILFHNVSDFDAVMDAVEDPALSPVARWLILSGVCSWCIMLDPAPPAYVARLVTAIARVVSQPVDASLQVNMLQTFLPNVLGIVGGAQPKPAREVFADQPERRVLTESLLAAYPDRAAATALLEWARA